MPPSIKKPKNFVSTIADSSAETQRGFSKMNVAYSDKISRLLEENIINLMTINLHSLPQEEWDPTFDIMYEVMATPKSFR